MTGPRLGLGLGLSWDHFQDIKFFILTSFDDFFLEVLDDTHLLHLVSNSKRLSFSQELTPTLTLGLNLGLGLGLELACGHLPGYTIFNLHKFERFFPERLRR